MIDISHVFVQTLVKLRHLAQLFCPAKLPAVGNCLLWVISCIVLG